MAGRALPLGLAGLVLALMLGPVAALALWAGGLALLPADWAALRFTLVQAVLSAGLSVALAVPVARALARRRFAGRGALITLMGAPFLLPVMVAVLGLLAVFGRAGVINRGLEGLGLPGLSIYGLQGVVLAHLFLNLPLAVRMILQGWQAIPAERFRLAEALDLGPQGIARHLERPMLREVLPGAALVILSLCLTSFAVALTLGGGPGATTVELAIWQAVRLEFDLAHAAGLGLVQVAVSALAAAAAWVWVRPAGFGAGVGVGAMPVIPAPGGATRAGDALAIVAAALFLLVPLGAVVLRGMPGVSELPPSVWSAAGRSLAVAVVSALLAVTVALVLALAVAQRGSLMIELAAALPLAVSGMVLGTGLFLLLQPVVSPQAVALPVTVGVNAALALPFLFRLLLPEARALRSDYGRLADSLGLAGWARLRWLVLPRLARPLGFGAGIAAALSMGDLGVIALFAGEQGVTLPLMIQRLIGAYRMEAAAGAALVLVGLSLALFWACDAGGRRAAA